ncbi:MAG: hypothetical protein HYR55_17360 [Acidobacteria bacterium]|nr:hypothetical protein [Acidobacteriota bacterium]MBI3656957.1 hypothetical protein [Acidobacteriota bacterium]
MKIEVMSHKGHELLSEVDEKTSPAELDRLDSELKKLMDQGYSAFLKESGLKIEKIDPSIKEDVVVIAPVMGG